MYNIVKERPTTTGQSIVKKIKELEDARAYIQSLAENHDKRGFKVSVVDENAIVCSRDDDEDLTIFHIQKEAA